MKVVFMFLLVLIICLNSLQGQIFETKNIDTIQLIVRYELHYQQDSTNSKNIRYEEMLLFIGNSTSMFMSYNTCMNDSVFMRYSKIEQADELLQQVTGGGLRTRFDYRIYKNYPAGKITFTDRVAFQNIYCTKPLEVSEWTLKDDDKKQILGHDAQKAVTSFAGREWEAWFTMEIPLSEGPYKFNGLPGLILKIQDTKKHYVFNIKEVYKPKNLREIYVVEKDYIYVNRKELFEIWKNEAALVVNTFKEWGNPPEVLKRVEDNAKRRNNRLELIYD